MTDELLDRLAGEAATVRAGGKANRVFMLACLTAGLVGVVQSIALGAWVAAGTLSLFLLSIGVSPFTTKGPIRRHLAACHPAGEEWTIVVSPTVLQLGSPNLYCEYWLGEVTSTVVKRYGVHLRFGAGVISLPREVLSDEDLANLRAGESAPVAQR